MSDQFSTEELTEVERQHIRRIIQADGRARWLWASIRTFAGWIVAVAAAVALAKAYFFDFFAWKH